jgi:hypothetical protein
MDLKKEFETLLKWGLKDTSNKKHLIQMASVMISCLNSITKKELSNEELEKIAAGAVAYTSSLTLR